MGAWSCAQGVWIAKGKTHSDAVFRLVVDDFQQLRLFGEEESAVREDVYLMFS